MSHIRWFLRVVVLLALVVLVTGCVPPSTPGEPLSSPVTPTPERMPGEQVVLGPDDALRVDAEHYAREFGVTVLMTGGSAVMTWTAPEANPTSPVGLTTMRS